MNKSEKRVLKQIKGQNKAFLKDAELKLVKITDGIGNGFIMIKKDGVVFNLGFISENGNFISWYMSDKEMQKQFDLYKTRTSI